MDLMCVCCGEPWNVDYVLQEATDEFNREGALIRGCPCCHGVEPKDMTEERRKLLCAAAAAIQLMGDDVDGAAALIENFF